MGSPIRKPNVMQVTELRPTIFDSGALIAIERGNEDLRALTRLFSRNRTPILVPSPVVAEVWRGGSGRQTSLSRFLNDGLQMGKVTVVDLPFEEAKEIGMILARFPMSVADAAVCRSSMRSRGTVVTSDPRDIQKVIPIERIKVV